MNTLSLIQRKNSSSLRHGGMQEYRNFDLLINDVIVDSFRDDAPATGYSRAESLDAMIDGRIAVLEKALGCKATREVNGRKTPPRRRVFPA
jgi:hypothetical protein